MASARDRILDACEELLLTEGDRAATLDAVAARAGVSKGGLIYHFPSKDLLAHGVCARLTSLAADDAALMRSAAEGPARFYIRSSRYRGTPLDRAIVAVARLHQGGNAEAVATLRSVEAQWLAILAEALRDDDAAQAIKLMGDGLYYEALFRLPTGSPPVESEAAGDDLELERLFRVIDKIVG